jgi:hypothetical protein
MDTEAVGARGRETLLDPLATAVQCPGIIPKYITNDANWTDARCRKRRCAGWCPDCEEQFYLLGEEQQAQMKNLYTVGVVDACTTYNSVVARINYEQIKVLPLVSTCSLV